MKSSVKRRSTPAPRSKSRALSSHHKGTYTPSTLASIIPHKYPTRGFTTKSTEFPPYRGLTQLKSSNLKLHVPSTDHIELSPKQVVKLADLTYLAPPRTAQQVKSIGKRAQGIVDILSKITHIDINNLSSQQSKIKHARESQINNDPYTFSDTSSIPFYTPLTEIVKHVPHDAINLHDSNSFATDNIGMLNTQHNLLRLRHDHVDEGGNSQKILKHASHTDRGFYVVPKSNSADLDE